MSLKDKLMGVPEAPSKPKEEEQLPTASKPASMADRIRQANKMKKANPNMMILTGSNVALLLDDSSSMGWSDSGSPTTRVEHLNAGVDLFADEIDFNQTKVTAIPFNGPVRDFATQGEMKAYKTQPSGGTPMADSIEQFNNLQDVNQAILISDGDADSPHIAIEKARITAETGKRIDCIHIGSSMRGENTLKQIAELTGGMFFKFKDLASFQKSLQQLAPAKRKQLASKSAAEIKQLTGATEVIK